LAAAPLVTEWFGNTPATFKRFDPARETRAKTGPDTAARIRGRSMDTGVMAFLVYFVRAAGLFLAIGVAVVMAFVMPFTAKGGLAGAAVAVLVAAGGVLSWPRWPGSWRTDAPSDKQIAYAENLGIRIPDGITKGRLSDMIEAAKQVRG
jgi:hypothetical protein